MTNDSAKRHPTSRGGHHVNETKRRAVGSSFVRGAASAQETTIKFTLGWKTQGSDAAFFYAKDNGYFKEEGLNVVIEPGRGLGCDGDTHHVGRL